MIEGPLISAAEALSLRRGSVFLDARAGATSSADYASSHVRGAMRVDLETDLSELTDPVRGGRHPLPDVRRWLETLGKWGITSATPVLLYDAAGGGLAAARAWWMLRAVGHRSVAVVDGGWDALCEAGAPIDASLPQPTQVGPYRSEVSRWPTVEVDHVERIRRDPAWRLIDARAPERYAGITEPIDPVAGHIPGAVNLHWQSQLDNGLFRPLDELRASYAELLGDAPAERVVCYCGSGVTACHVLLAMEACGLSGARLYVGSWSEWCRQGRPRAPE